MTKSRSSHPSFGSRLIRRVAPVLTALAVSWSSVYLHADQSAGINAELAQFAADKTAGTPKAVTILTAPADDLVFAVYDLAPNYPDDPNGLADLVVSALAPIGGKVRADKDKIAPRLVAAALLGSRQIGTAGFDALAADIAAKAALSNVSTGNVKLELTAAGRAAVVAQALKSVSGDGDTAGNLIAAKVVSQALASNSAGTGDAKLQAFTLATLKLVGTAPGAVTGFTSKLLSDPAGVSGDLLFANNLVNGLAATLPDVAGKVAGGYADTLTSDADIEGYAKGLIGNPKVAKAISAVVSGTFLQLNGTSASTFTSDLVLSLTPSTKQTTATRGAIASGVLRSLAANTASGTVDGVIDASLSVGKALTKTDLAVYAAAAAVGTSGAVAGEVAVKTVTKLSGATVTDIGNVGKAVIKAIAVSAPASALNVSSALIAANPTVLSSDILKTSFAQTLVLAVPTNGPATGAAVAGVAGTLSAQTGDNYVTLGAATILKAPKASVDIAKSLSALSTVSTGSFATFAANFAKFSATTETNAASIAAGVAISSVGGNGAAGNGGVNGVVDSNKAVAAGQSAGDIVVAVANADTAQKLQAKLITIAGATANVVDVERIADIGNKVGSVLGAASTKYPKLTSIGTLATALGKAINTKPLTSTANRVDELGELAAELTRASVNSLGTTGLTQAALETALISVGTSLYKTLSAALLQNGGVFAADKKDAAADIAGAIAQTLSVIGINNPTLNGFLTNASGTNLGTGLLDAGGKLAKALVTAAGATTFGKNVGFAFADVRGALGNTDRLVVGTETVSNVSSGGTITGQGKYEIGAVIDAETPILALP